MSIMIYALDIAASELFIILLTIFIILVPSKITSLSKTIGRFIGEYEKNNLLQQQKSIDSQTYIEPQVQRPVSSDREKLEMIAKWLNLDIEYKPDGEIRNSISSDLK